MEDSDSDVSSLFNLSIETVIENDNFFSNYLLQIKLFEPANRLEVVDNFIKKKIPISQLQQYSNIYEILGAAENPNFLDLSLVLSSANEVNKYFNNLKFSPKVWLTNYDKHFLRIRGIPNCVVKINNRERNKMNYSNNKGPLHEKFISAFDGELQKKGSFENLIEICKFETEKTKLKEMKTSNQIQTNPTFSVLRNKRKIGPKSWTEKRRKLQELNRIQERPEVPIVTECIIIKHAWK